MRDTSGGARERVVFWDFDGTLAKRPHLWSGALRDALLRVDPSSGITPEQLRPGLIDGFPWHTPEVTTGPLTPAEWWARIRPMFVAAFTRTGVDRAVAERAADLAPTEFYRVDAWEVVDGAETALTLTQDAGYRNVILSNHAPELAGLVDGLGLSTWIDLTITSASVGAEKPHPAIFERALRAAHAGPDTWMVGDNPVADVEGARRAGIRAILADGSYCDSVGVTVLEAARLIVGAP